jgi:EAL domain-containing protein (putative c-di-GMP-specific phosphodiesterase class I)
MPVSRVADVASLTFDELLRRRAIHPVFQPVVCIDDGEVVGFEALARGPAGSPWSSPDALFAEAYRTGKAAELDWICRLVATRTFAAAGMPEPIVLFVNVEPLTFGSSCPPDLVEPLTTAMAENRRMILEITERSVTRDPAEMLRAVEDARRKATGVAIDDVGAEPASLAMMPLIRPDVIKLDLTLARQRSSRATARIVSAVLAESERTGAAVLAEGIESDHDLQVAQAMGATLGQGWYFGAPEPAPTPPPAPRHPLDLLPAVDFAALSTPFDAVRDRRLSRGTEPLLRPLSRHLEHHGLDAADPTVLLAGFQDADRFGEATRRRYEEVAKRGVLTAVLGRDMPTEPGPGIRGARLDPSDPITQEWAVIVLGSEFAGALLAKERVGESAVFDFVVTHDRELVIAAAQPLIRRILASDR